MSKLLIVNWHVCPCVNSGVTHFVAVPCPGPANYTPVDDGNH